MSRDESREGGKFSKLIAKVRQQTGASQDEIAVRIVGGKFSRRYYGDVERGKRRVSVLAAWEIGIALEGKTLGYRCLEALVYDLITDAGLNARVRISRQ